MAETVYGTTSGGEQVRAFRLGGDKLSAVILDMGGTITEITVAGRDGRRRNVVLGLEDLAAYEASGWWNCLIGRYANRLKGGITLAGRHYPLIQDDNGVTLHGGRGLSWGSRLWEVTAHSDKGLFLKLVSADGDQGFPGTMTVEVTYTISGNALRLDYAAVCDAPTVDQSHQSRLFQPGGRRLGAGAAVAAQCRRHHPDRQSADSKRQDRGCERHARSISASPMRSASGWMPPTRNWRWRAATTITSCSTRARPERWNGRRG